MIPLRCKTATGDRSPFFFAVVVAVAMLVGNPARAMDLGMAKEDGGQAGALFDFAASARSLGMGRAHVAVADDASGAYWNPAGLSQVERKNVVAMYSVLQENTGFGSVNFAMPSIDYGTFGVGLVSLRSTNYEKRQAGDGALLGSYDQSETGITLSNGFRFAPHWSVGTSLKVANEKIDTFSGTGYGADAGLMWFLHPRVQFGLSAQNLWAPQIKLKSQTDTYARAVRLGTKIEATPTLLIAADLVQTENRSAKLNLGTEWRAGSGLALRAGLNDTEVTAGLGLRFDDWSLDYAFGYQQSVGGVDSLGSTHRLGFSVYFGEKVSDTGFSMRWQRKAKLVLQLLREQMSDDSKPIDTEIGPLATAVQEIVTHQGFVKAEDLYTAQGYVYYLKGDFERSVRSLNEALALDPSNEELKKNLEKAQKFLTETETRKMVTDEMKTMKDLYRKGDYQGAEVSCRKVLSIVPDHVEAAAYLDDVERRINEPIARELKIATSKMDREEYLDAIKHLQIVKTLDPKNEDAQKMISTAIGALERQAQLQSKEKKAKEVKEVEKPRVYEITQDPNRSRQLYSQGLMLYSRGKLRDALMMWEQAVKVDTDNQLARSAYNRGLAELQESENQ